MSLTFYATFIGLLIGHLLADFFWQKTAWVHSRNQRHWRSEYLYVHGAMAGVLPVVFAGLLVAFMTAIKPYSLYSTANGGSWLLTLVVLVVLHTGIDLGKSYLPGTPGWFLADQAAHGLCLLLAALYLNPGATHQFLGLLGQHLGQKPLIYLTTSLLLTLPTSHLLKIVLRQFGVKVDEEVATLPRGGELIGIVERQMILICILSQSPEAIGWMLGSKSILRFSQVANDSQRTEYVLAGTLCSTFIAVVLSLMAQGVA